MRQKEPVAGRVDPETKRLIERAAAEAGVTESEIVRRGMTTYVRENPDGYEALRPVDSLDRFVSELLE